MRQLLTESLLLFSLGGAGRLLLSMWGVKLLLGVVRAQMLSHLPRSGNVQVNGLALLFTLAVTVATAVIFGLAPALIGSRQDLNRATREGGARHTGGRGGQAFRGAIVVFEVALAVVLSVGAGLLVKTFVHLQTMNHGFQPDHLMKMPVQLPPARYPAGLHVTQLYEQLLERMGTLAGVPTAGLIDFLPFWGGNVSGPFSIDGAPCRGTRPRPRRPLPVRNRQAISRP